MPLPVCLCFCLSQTILPNSFQCQNVPNGRIQRKKVVGIFDHRCSSGSKRSWLACLHWWMYVCLSKTNVALAQDNNNLYKLCVGHFFVKADTCRWVYQKFRYTSKEISLKMPCADPKTFVWRAGYYRPYSGFAVEMAFRCPTDCGPTLNADFVALRDLVGSKPVLLRNPIVLWFPMGPHPSPSGSVHECTATPRISLL